MRLHEITAPQTYFIMVDCPHKIGSVVSVQGTVCPLGAFFEGRLENVRPENDLSRGVSLYLHEKAPDGGEHIYEVLPLKPVHSKHYAWLKQLQQTTIGAVGAIDHFSRAYWSGQVCPELRNDPWEHRTTEAKVIRRVGGQALAYADGTLV